MSDSLTFSTAVRDDEHLRASFNRLTRLTFGFDFTAWHAAGGWSDLYQPHVLVDGDEVVSNVSVNRMSFRASGVHLNLIQLGTVMTHPDYRGRGLNRRIMERVLALYEKQADAIYLFANDSVLNYYPKFGFRPCEEYEYYLPATKGECAPYRLIRVDQSDVSERLSRAVRENGPHNPNDGLYMDENLGLYQFWMGAGYGGSVYFLPECNAHVSATMQAGILHVHQIWGKQKVDLRRLSRSFGQEIRETIPDYTPAQTDNLPCRPYREEDTTLFVLGDGLSRIGRQPLRLPIFSHA